MAVIHLLRHAKSAWDDPELDDHDRPLAPRGQRAAAAVGVYLQQQAVAPDLVICSTSLRTRETYAIIEEHLPEGTEVRFEAGVYHASVMRLFELCATAGDGIDDVMVIGHNPGMHSLAFNLAAGGDGDALGRLRLKFPTAALASIEVDGPLSSLKAGRGSLLRFVVPKDLV